MFKIAIQVACFFLPWKMRRWIFVKLFGFTLDTQARIGLSIIFADNVEMSRGARLGHFNYVGKLDKLQMDEDASIGNFNWIVGLSRRLNSTFFCKNLSRRSELIMGKCSAILHQHVVDCTDRIELGPFAVIAGYRSQLLTHGIDIIRCQQSCAPIIIGAYTMVGAASLLQKGVRIPDYCIISSGSVVSRHKIEPYSLIAGNPAMVVRKVPETAKWYSRSGSVIY